MFIEILPLLEKNIVMYDKYIRGLIEEDTVKLHCFLELAIRVHIWPLTHRELVAITIYGNLHCRPSAGFCTRLTLQAATRPPLKRKKTNYLQYLQQ